MSTSPSLPPCLANELIQSIPEGILVLDADGMVKFCNASAERITGWSADEVTGQPVNRVLTLGGSGETFLERVAVAGSAPVEVTRRDGQVVSLAVSRSEMQSAECPGPQTVLVLRDVTESAAAQQLRSYFLGNISHEFRTPLSALKASVELLLDDVDDISPQELKTLLNSIHLSVTGLQTLIDNLLESVSIEAGRFKVRPRPTDFHRLVDDAEKVMRPLLARRNQTLTVQLPADLPRVNVDPMRLTQVLVNLLSNASKYSPLDKPIRLDLELVPGSIKVSVSDEGSGIPPEERANVFRRFVRLHDEKDKAQYGVGLGLSVVKTIVEQHGGTVGLDARPGGGSIFWFTIPLEEETR